MASAVLQALAKRTVSLGAPSCNRSGPRFVHQQSLTAFREILGEKGVTTDPVALQGHNFDWFENRTGGKATVVLAPASTAEVSKVLSYCNRQGIPVVPQGGNTGVVGGGIASQPEEVLLSMSRMDKILAFSGGVVVAESGCILEVLDSFVREQGYCIPLDLGAKGSCQIGGNVSTHAGGIRFVRHGPLRGGILGLEVVLADGTVLDCLKTLRKDNTGYDLKQLFIGSEGTLGVVTKVALKCVTTSKATNTLLMSLSSFEGVKQTFGLANKHLAEVLSAFEFFDRQSMGLALQHVKGAVNPFQDISNMYVLVETAGSNGEHDMEKLETFVGECSQLDTMQDAVIAQDTLQTQNIWAIRDGMAEAVVRHGKAHMYDLSVSQDRMYEAVEIVRERMHAVSEDVVTIGFGHFGDGNLHLLVADARENQDAAVKEQLEPFIFEWTRAAEGSISAEHGIGVHKKSVLHYSQPPEAVQLMQKIKTVLDPTNTLNPGKIVSVAAA